MLTLLYTMVDTQRDKLTTAVGRTGDNTCDGVLWQNIYISPEFGTKFRREVLLSLFLRYPSSLPTQYGISEDNICAKNQFSPFIHFDRTPTGRGTLMDRHRHRRNLRGYGGYAYPRLFGEGVLYPPLFGRMTKKITANFH